MPDHDPLAPGAVPRPPGPSGPPAGPRSADIGIRIVARFLDELLLLIANVLVVSPLFATWRGAETAGAALGLAGPGAAFAVGLVALTVSLGYYAGLEALSGRTVGKRLVGLRTVGPDGERPSLGQALRRNAWIAVVVVPRIGLLLQVALAVAIIVTVSRSRTDQGIHDELAGGTSVLRD